MGKYDPLHFRLASPARGVSEITLSFSQLEQLLGHEFPLHCQAFKPFVGQRGALGCMTAVIFLAENGLADRHGRT
jgi:hypothetical protein